MKIVWILPTGVGERLYHLYMDDALVRHPCAHLVPLPRVGAGSILGSAEKCVRDIEKIVGPDEPFILAGHSQGALVAACIAAGLVPITNPGRIKHLILVGSPFHGAWLSYLLPIFPSAHDMRDGSPFLTKLLAKLRGFDGRITNILTNNERVMRADSCIIEGFDNLDNVLVGNKDQVRDFLRRHPNVEFDQVIVSKLRANHLNAMIIPELRAVVWETADAVSVAHGIVADGPPAEKLMHRNVIFSFLLR